MYVGLCVNAQKPFSVILNLLASGAPLIRMSLNLWLASNVPKQIFMYTFWVFVQTSEIPTNN